MATSRSSAAMRGTLTGKALADEINVVCEVVWWSDCKCAPFKSCGLRQPAGT